MRMDKLTSMFQQALAQAQSYALGLDNNFIEPEHLLKAFLVQTASSYPALLTKAGADVAKLKQLLDEALQKLPTIAQNQGDVHVSNTLSRLLNLTDKLSQQKKDAYISSELFLLAAIDHDNNISRLLKQAGATPRSANSPCLH